jgi:hypothetical protein
MDAYLDGFLRDHYQGDLNRLARAFLPEHIAKRKPSRKAIYQAIASEYAFQDIVFNFYEEEYIAGWELHLVNRKLRRYWKEYMKQSFANAWVREHWKMRKEIGRNSPAFERFVVRHLIEPQEDRTVSPEDQQEIFSNTDEKLPMTNKTGRSAQPF